MKTAIEQLTTESLDLVMLSLANACYQDQGGGGSKNKSRTENVQYYVENLPPISTLADSNGQGYFTVEWGPGDNGNNANLMYLASYRKGSRPAKQDAPSKDNAPEFLVVGIRGTDILSSFWGVIKQVREDLDASAVTPWAAHLNSLDKKYRPGPDSQIQDLGAVAKGTVAGFDTMISLTHKSRYDTTETAQTMIDFLHKYTAATDSVWSDVPIMVTGHSLGGGQTQVMASYLAWQLDGKGASTPVRTNSRVIPVAFAPPTAGDNIFAAIYNEWFPTSRYWINELDLVPQAFWNLKWAKRNMWAYNKDTADHSELGGNPILWPAKSIWGELDLSYKSGPDLVKYIALNNGLLEKVVNKKLDNFIAKAAKHTYTTPAKTIVKNVNTTQVLPTPREIVEDIYKKADEKGKTPNPTTALAMLEWQHFPPAYYRFMKELHVGLTDYPLQITIV